jgi:DNA polymerase I-like protein with 3'-5' exonuclease and polymerase domains
MTSYGSTFLDEIHPFTQRIHADFQQIGTATGRFACKSPNLQQMPDEFRQCVSLKDHKMVIADFSQIELRILAEYSDDPAFVAAFNTGKDLHTSTAATMFNIPIDSVNDEQRFMAKTINFGLSYGMGVMKLMDMLNQRAIEAGTKPVNIRQVQTIMNRYKATYKGVTEWLQQAGEMAYRQGYSTTMLGRRRLFPRPEQGIDGDSYMKEISSIKRQGANSPIQGTNADITKLAMIALYKDLQKYNFRAKLIIQVHDEVVVLAHKSQAETIKDIVVESMLGAAQEVLKKIPVKVDAYVSDIWKKK